jgi:hypothetical protein
VTLVQTDPDTVVLTDDQEAALRSLCDRFNEDFEKCQWGTDRSLPDGYVCGWIGRRIYIGCSAEGAISS